MYCTNCGNEIHEHAKFCPECGAPQLRANHDTNNRNNNEDYNDNTNYYNTENYFNDEKESEEMSTYSTLCILGLIFSCIALFIDFLGLISILGVIFSVIGLIGTYQRKEQGVVLAIIGLVIGVVACIF